MFVSTASAYNEDLSDCIEAQRYINPLRPRRLAQPSASSSISIIQYNIQNFQTNSFRSKLIIKMKFLAVLAIAATAAASALPATAAPAKKLSASAALLAHGEGATCTPSGISCCSSPEETRNDGLLNGLLDLGLLSGLNGNDHSACAKTSLIDHLGLLSLVDDKEDGYACKNIVACCTDGATCIAIDNEGGKASGSAGDY
ncbi:hypothetical protein BDW74DRAFT_154895 [Aspergillus multicolor]|uniref:uncharacterized protein n=1 Tax=Aspergillus multicolor TaxID=41759 RepID=UPI003CCDA5BD